MLRVDYIMLGVAFHVCHCLLIFLHSPCILLARYSE